MSIDFIVDLDGFSFNEESSFRAKAKSLLSAEGFSKELLLQVIYLSDEALLEMNKEYLDHDYYTDIITFPIEETEDQLEAELYISIDRVKENAQMEGVGFSDELLRVYIHGILHLVGYDDDTQEAKSLMRDKESQYMAM